MNELFFSLLESMKEEAACYRRLCVFAREQKEELMAGNVGALSAKIRLQEKQVFALTPLIGRRDECLAQLAKFFGMKKMNLREAVGKAPESMAEELKKVRMDLMESAQTLASLNGMAKKLLGNAMKLTRFTLKVIREGGKKKSFSTTTGQGSMASFVNRVV